MAAKDNILIIDRLRLPKTEEERRRDIVGYIRSTLENYKNARGQLEETWLDSWAAYFGSSEALDHQRNNALRVIGNVNVDWRHKINVGKAFEVVETVVGYLAAALFPTRDWMTVEPREPMNLEMARVLRRYFNYKLDEWAFKPHFIANLRQLAITGSSCFAIPWKDKRIKFETLDNFDVFVDPNASDNTNCNVLRRIILSRAEILTNIRRGLYKNITEWDCCNIHGSDHIYYNDKSQQVREFQGIATDFTYSLHDKIIVWEFWGDVHLPGICYYNHYALVIGDHLVKFEENPYDAGKPIVFGTYTPVVRQPYGMSAIQSSLGMMHALNVVTNQRLDNVELSINCMYLKKQSSATPTTELYSEPGKILEVLEMDEIKPLQQDNSQLMVSYQEAGLIEAAVEKNTGTGPLISTGQPRGGERVTASEVQMVREAGSNRLSTIHKHIETTILIPVLQSALTSIRQFENTDEMIRIAGSGKDEYRYYNVGPEEIRNQKFVLKPRGADYIIEQRDYVEKRTAFIQLVTSIPQFAQKINYDKLLSDLLQNWGFDDPEAYMLSEESPTGETTPITMGAQLEAMGGKGLLDGATQEVMSDGGGDALNKLTGIELPQGVNFNDVLTEYFTQRTAAEQYPLQPTIE